jgi:hypothetical protein
VEAQRILIGTRDIGREVGLDRIEIEKIEVIGLERGEVDSRRVGLDVRRYLMFVRRLGRRRRGLGLGLDDRGRVRLGRSRRRRLLRGSRGSRAEKQ